VRGHAGLFEARSLPVPAVSRCAIRVPR
jgi:hypothetical protein